METRTVAWLGLALLAGRTVLLAQTPVVSGFTDSLVLSGLTRPTAVQFSADGRVFVAEKSGLIKVFQDLADPEPVIFADLRTSVHNYWDRGLLGMVLDPEFPARPYVYVIYTYDGPAGGASPRWGAPGQTSDGCPSPPGPTDQGCEVSARLSRLQASGDLMVAERVLVHDWFQQFPSHSIGSLAFGADGALYASGGDGASYQFVDYGQRGNPGGDPPVGIGGEQSPPTAEGGALRSQDVRTPADPTGLNGTVIRVNAETGAALPDNPWFASADARTRRIVGFGLRNPFRMAVRPGTREIWIGDVGWRQWEEINVIPDPLSPTVANFGWPCYEGSGRQGGYDSANLQLCESLYALPAAGTAPRFAYQEGAPVVAGEACPTTDASVTALAFYRGGSYPRRFHGALFFADYTRRCIWAMLPDAAGVPDASRIVTFVTAAGYPVDLQPGPGGDLFYVDFQRGAVRRLGYSAANTPPHPQLAATPTSGPVPLTVQFDGRGSWDAEDAALTYDWDLTGDGVFGDSASPAPVHTFATAGTRTVSLRVVDSGGPSAVATVSITAGSCHEHAVQQFDGVSGGSFTAPDHDYPSYLTLRLTARDAGGLEHSVVRRLDPQTVTLRVDSAPQGLQLGVGSEALVTPIVKSVLLGSTVTVSAPSPQALAGGSAVFDRWSDGRAQTHGVVVNEGGLELVAFYQSPGVSPPAGWTGHDIGTTGGTGTGSYAGGTFTLRAYGADIWSTSDAFHFVHQAWTGDGELLVRVNSIPLPSGATFALAGIMFRESLAPGARHASVLIGADGKLKFRRRTAEGGTTLSDGPSAGSIAAPYWLKLVRAGTVITAYRSGNGTSWVKTGPALTLPLPATIEAGIWAARTGGSLPVIASFGAPILMSPGWTAGDVGAAGTAGATSLGPNGFVLRGAGSDLWGSADALHLLHRRWTGDGDLVVRVDRLAGPAGAAWAMAGITFRESLDASARHASLLISTEGKLKFRRRQTAAGTTLSDGPSTGSTYAPRWLKLTRRGNVFTAFASRDGTLWTQVHTPQTLPLPAAVEAGIWTLRSGPGGLSEAEFSSLALRPWP